jgi:hypothetical protein
MLRSPDHRLPCERPDRPGGRLEPSADRIDGPSTPVRPDEDWAGTADSALDSFDSESVEPSADAPVPLVPSPPPPLPIPPVEPATLPRAPLHPNLAPEDRELFKAVQESRTARRTTGLTSSVAGMTARAWQGLRASWEGRRARQAERARYSRTAAAPRAAGKTAPRLKPAAFAVTAAALLTWAVWYVGGRTGGAWGGLTVTTKPPGGAIVIDGQSRGAAPATIRLEAGVHTLEVRSAGPAQVATVRIEAGGDVSRFFELTAGTSGARLQVTTKPAGALLTIDGRARGRTPITVNDLNPGAHLVRVRRGSQSAERLIMLESGANGTVSLPLEGLGGVATEGHGWLDASVSVDARAIEGGRPVGSTRAGPWQLPAGRHELTFINQELGVQITRAVEIVSGRTVTLDVVAEPGQLSITTTPAAEIVLDGDPLGPAPIVKRPIAAGQHDLIARHPVLGERRLLLSVAAGTAMAVTLDLRRR